jgi:hypothetical protein
MKPEQQGSSEMQIPRDFEVSRALRSGSPAENEFS